MKEYEPCTGSVQPKNGQWYTIINVTINGKRTVKWQKTGLPVKGNKKAAKIILEQRKREYDALYGKDLIRNVDGVNASMLLSDYLIRWTNARKTEVAHETYQSRMQMAKGRIRRYFDPKGITLGNLTHTDVYGFYDELRDEELAGTTLIHYHQFINQALKAAVRQDIILRNVMDKVDRPKKNSYTGDFYSPDEVAQLFGIFKDDPLYPLVYVTVHYGLRRSEALGLHWSSISFQEDTLSVNYKVYEDSEDGDSRGLVITSDLKTKNSRRTLPLFPEVKELLLQMKADQSDNRKAFGNGYNRDYDDMVFVNGIGELFRPNYVTDHFHAVLSKSDLRVIRFHDLRHTCASLLVSKGIDMKQIQLWLGHANYSTTADIYSHLDSKALRVAADALQKTLHDPKKNEDEENN